MTCQRMVSVSLIFGAESSALVIVTQILPAKSDLSSVFGQDETYVHLCTGHTSLSQMPSKVIKVQITDCFIYTLDIK
jgi:hypothetical protein